jgi:hypothetical protein
MGIPGIFVRSLVTVCALSAAAAAAAACVPFTDAKKSVGDEVCVTGKVVKVGQSSRSGTHFLNFCEDYRNCPFTVVIFAKDLQRVGDVRELEGKEIKIFGKVRDYKGQAEIILNDARQLKGEKYKLPPLPKNYDASTRGKYSAGTFDSGKPSKRKREKRKPHGPTEQEQPEEDGTQ